MQRQVLPVHKIRKQNFLLKGTVLFCEIFGVVERPKRVLGAGNHQNPGCLSVAFWQQQAVSPLWLGFASAYVGWVIWIEVVMTAPGVNLLLDTSAPVQPVPMDQLYKRRSPPASVASASPSHHVPSVLSCPFQSLRVAGLGVNGALVDASLLQDFANYAPALFYHNCALAANFD